MGLNQLDDFGRFPPPERSGSQQPSEGQRAVSGVRRWPAAVCDVLRDVAAHPAAQRLLVRLCARRFERLAGLPDGAVSRAEESLVATLAMATGAESNAGPSDSSASTSLQAASLSSSTPLDRRSP